MNILPFNEPFDLKLTLKCGQGHRWLKEPENPGLVFIGYLRPACANSANWWLERGYRIW